MISLTFTNFGIPLLTYRPEVVDKDVENAQDGDEDYGTPLGLETNNNHHAGNETNHDDRNATNAPLAGKDEANEEENEQHAASELEIHLAVLLIELRQAGGRELFANPAVGQDHEQATHDTQVTQEEVEVEDQAVAERLRDDNADQTHDSVLAVLADDDHEGGGEHGDNVDDEEEVRDAGRNCGESVAVSHWFLKVFPYSHNASSSFISLVLFRPDLPIPQATDLGFSTYYACNRAGTPADHSIASKCATHLPGK